MCYTEAISVTELEKEVQFFFPLRANYKHGRKQKKKKKN